MEVYASKIKILFYSMSYSYLYVGKSDISLNTLSYLNKIDSIYTTSNTLKIDINFNIKYYGINGGSNNFQEVWNSFSNEIITLKSQIIYYIYMKEPFDFSTAVNDLNQISYQSLSTDDRLANNTSDIVYIRNPTINDICNNAIYISNDTEYLTESVFEGVKDEFNIEFEENSRLEIIQNEACSNSHILSVIIPRNIKEIGEQAFFDCPLLTNVIFESNSNLQKIGAQVFVNAISLTDITIPSDVEELQTGLFNGCKQLKTISFENTSMRPSKLKRIENFVFNGTKVKSLDIPPSIEYLDNYALQGLENITLFISKDSLLKLPEETYSTLYGAKNVTIKYHK